MKFRIYTEENQQVSNWSGGETRELAVFPEDATYLDRDFIWRLSTASSDREESSFSRMEGFERILMVLEGDVVLAHGQERSVNLKALDQDRFDGGLKTRCFGRFEKDYNLIMARGCEGSLDILELTQDAKAMGQAGQPASSADPFAGYRSYGAYCLDGYAVISCGERTEMIRPGTQAVIDLDPGDDMIPTIMGEGRCVIASVAFEAGEESIDTDERVAPAPAKSSFASEYGICMKLLARNNRWSKMMRREGADDVYYDRALSKALAKIERKYITTIVWAAGCALCLIPAVFTGRLGICFVAAAVFTCIHLLLIAPFIYWKMLPGPIAFHIKSTDELNAFEKIHHQEEISEDPHMDRLMRKYKSDDENYFADESSPLYKLVKKK